MREGANPRPHTVLDIKRVGAGGDRRADLAPELAEVGRGHGAHPVDKVFVLVPLCEV